ncbi:hypothetical protein HELRODRAFT_166421 [Helobdella robusta]|uniref:Uncharacterized protein n=1 Tax=Helobdella robusta TaxID=6412 RepID=T1EY43_HELRO|nr:hypothetical protein HELRODRAFT_166421 [Helobdella robusta]ESN90718.1 hypothetical protein HELRODRAFT_166421 [Helobdella robusta]
MASTEFNDVSLENLQVNGLGAVVKDADDNMMVNDVVSNGVKVYDDVDDLLQDHNSSAGPRNCENIGLSKNITCANSNNDNAVSKEELGIENKGKVSNNDSILEGQNNENDQVGSVDANVEPRVKKSGVSTVQVTVKAAKDGKTPQKVYNHTIRVKNNNNIVLETEKRCSKKIEKAITKPIEKKKKTSTNINSSNRTSSHKKEEPTLKLFDDDDLPLTGKVSTGRSKKKKRQNDDEDDDNDDGGGWHMMSKITGKIFDDDDDDEDRYYDDEFSSHHYGSGQSKKLLASSSKPHSNSDKIWSSYAKKKFKVDVQGGLKFTKSRDFNKSKSVMGSGSKGVHQQQQQHYHTSSHNNNSSSSNFFVSPPSSSLAAFNAPVTNLMDNDELERKSSILKAWETKLKCLDSELEDRANTIKRNEGKMVREERRLKEIENSLKYREKILSFDCLTANNITNNDETDNKTSSSSSSSLHSVELSRQKKEMIDMMIEYKEWLEQQQLLLRSSDVTQPLTLQPLPHEKQFNDDVVDNINDKRNDDNGLGNNNNSADGNSGNKVEELLQENGNNNDSNKGSASAVVGGDDKNDGDNDVADDDNKVNNDDSGHKNDDNNNDNDVEMSENVNASSASSNMGFGVKIPGGSDFLEPFVYDDDVNNNENDNDDDDDDGGDDNNENNNILYGNVASDGNDNKNDDAGDVELAE